MIYYSITIYYIILSHAWWKNQLLSHLRLFTTPLLCPWNSPRQECWSVLPFPSPRDHPNPGIEPGLLHCRWILYHLSHQRRSGKSPNSTFCSFKPAPLPVQCFFVLVPTSLLAKISTPREKQISSLFPKHYLYLFSGTIHPGKTYFLSSLPFPIISSFKVQLGLQLLSVPLISSCPLGFLPPRSLLLENMPYSFGLFPMFYSSISA